MMKTVSNITKIVFGVVVVAVPYAVSASMMENEDSQVGNEVKMKNQQAEHGAKMENRQNMRQEKMGERQAERTTNMEERQAGRQEKFCENFTARMGDMENKLTDRKGKFVDRKKKRVDHLDEKRDTRDNSLTEKREEQDARRNAWYEKLEAAADTPEKKTALVEFKKTIEAAVEVRRGAVDTAMSAFRSSVDAAVTTQKENHTGGVDTFEASVGVAMSQAKKDCADGKSAETVKSTFQSALKSARNSLQSERQEGEKLGVIIKDLAEKRQVEMRSALDAFKKTADQARADLKTAFGTGEVK